MQRDDNKDSACSQQDLAGAVPSRSASVTTCAGVEKHPAPPRGAVTITTSHASAIVNDDSAPAELRAACNRIVSDAQVIANLNYVIDQRDEEIASLRAMVVRLGGVAS